MWRGTDQGATPMPAHHPHSPPASCRDLRLDKADSGARVWQATGNKRSAIQRHKPVLQPAGRARQGGIAAPAAARGGPGAEAAAAVAAWAAGNPEVVAALRQRVAALMIR